MFTIVTLQWLSTNKFNYHWRISVHYFFTCSFPTTHSNKLFTSLVNLETQLVIPTIPPYGRNTREALLSEHNVKISLMILQIGRVKHYAKAQLSEENIYKRLYIFIEGRSTDVICDQCLLLTVGTWLLSFSRLRTITVYSLILHYASRCFVLGERGRAYLLRTRGKLLARVSNWN